LLKCCVLSIYNHKEKPLKSPYTPETPPLLGANFWSVLLHQKTLVEETTTHAKIKELEIAMDQQVRRRALLLKSTGSLNKTPSR
jgi:hypothetical protein